MAKHAVVAFTVLGLLARSVQSWAAFNVGTVNSVHAVLDNEGSYPLDGYVGLIQPGQEAGCPYEDNGCTNTGGRCDLGTTLQIGYQAPDGSGDAGGTQTVTGYNGGVFDLSFDLPAQGPYMVYCWIHPCQGPDINADGSVGIPAGTAC